MALVLSGAQWGAALADKEAGGALSLLGALCVEYAKVQAKVTELEQDKSRLVQEKNRLVMQLRALQGCAEGVAVRGGVEVELKGLDKFKETSRGGHDARHREEQVEVELQVVPTDSHRASRWQRFPGPRPYWRRFEAGREGNLTEWFYEDTELPAQWQTTLGSWKKHESRHFPGKEYWFNAKTRELLWAGHLASAAALQSRQFRAAPASRGPHRQQSRSRSRGRSRSRPAARAPYMAGAAPVFAEEGRLSRAQVPCTPASLLASVPPHRRAPKTPASVLLELEPPRASPSTPAELLKSAPSRGYAPPTPAALLVSLPPSPLRPVPDTPVSVLEAAPALPWAARTPSPARLRGW